VTLQKRRSRNPDHQHAAGISKARAVLGLQEPGSREPLIGGILLEAGRADT